MSKLHDHIGLTCVSERVNNCVENPHPGNNHMSQPRKPRGGILRDDVITQPQVTDPEHF
jgi:hypothetical protein